MQSNIEGSSPRFSTEFRASLTM